MYENDFKNVIIWQLDFELPPPPHTHTIPFGPRVDLMRSPMAIAPTNEDCRGRGKHKKLIVCKLKYDLLQYTRLLARSLHKLLTCTFSNP